MISACGFQRRPRLRVRMLEEAVSYQRYRCSVPGVKVKLCQGRRKSVTGVLQECYASVTKVLQESRVLQECYASVTRVLRECCTRQVKG
jgi:hypothetical protein